MQDCSYYPGEEPDCTDGEIVDCIEDDDKCGILNATLASGIRFVKWNCARTTRSDCSEEEVCDQMEGYAEDNEDTVKSCSVNCCDIDECNVPGKEDEVATVVGCTCYSCFFFLLCHTNSK